MTTSIPADATLDTVVRLYPLTFLDEGEEVTVGRADVDSYCVLPADGAALLRQLADGKSPRSAAQWYQETFGEQVDVLEFLEAMAELEFVLPDGAEVGPPPAPPRWQGLGRATFSPWAWAAYAILGVATAVAMVDNTALVPQYSNLFFSRYITVLEVVLFFSQFPLVLLHELFHVLAGRRLGLRSTLSVGRRLNSLVFETGLDGLLTVPRRKRWLPILAGVVCDLLVFCVLTLVAAATWHSPGVLGGAGRICLAMAFATVLRIVWQGFFYLRTDLYQLVVTVLGCVNLHATTKQVLRNRLHRLTGRRAAIVDESVFHPVDRRAARWYSWLVPLGYTFSIATLVFALVPSAVRVLGTVFGRLIGSRHDGGAGVADSIVFLVLNLGETAVIVGLAVRDRRAARRQVPAVHVVA